MGILGKIGEVVGDAYFPGASNMSGYGGNSTDMFGDMMTGGAISNARAVDANNARLEANAQKQMDFQERMRNTAWQAAVKDMAAAGLNPALAYTQGPAATPSGAAAQTSAGRPGDKGAGLMGTAKDIASMGMQGKTAMTQQELNTANTQLAEVQAQRTEANAKEAELNQSLIQERTKKEREAAKREKIAREVEQAQAPSQKTEAKINEKAVWFDAIADRIKSFIPFTRSNAKTYNFKGSGDTHNTITNQGIP